MELRAQTDDLTGLLNHGTFENRLERSVHAGSPFSLIMLDLDDFRDVNNSLGHQAGDQLLREIATELVRAGRDSDQSSATAATSSPSCCPAPMPPARAWSRSGRARRSGPRVAA